MANVLTAGGNDWEFSASPVAKQRLPHGLLHTIQQRDNAQAFARQSTSTSNLSIDPDDTLEQDADRVAEQIVSSATVGAVQRDFGHDLSPARVLPESTAAKSAR